MGSTVLLRHPIEHLAAAGILEVGIYIRQRYTVGVQESLEQQVVLQRIEVGYFQAVRDHRTGSGATSRSDAHIQFLTGGTDKVHHNEEVSGEAHGFHRMEFKLDTLLLLVGQRVTVALVSTFVGEVLQIIRLKLDAVEPVVAAEFVDTFFRLLLGHDYLAVLVARELVVELLVCELLPPLLLRAERLRYIEQRHNRVFVQVIDLHLACHLQGVGECFWYIVEDSLHFLGCLEPLLLGVHQFAWFGDLLVG